MRSRGLLTVAIALATASAAAARIAVVGPGGGGDIECVLASRHDPSRLFAGCDVGGFYFSSDFGRHWEIRNVGLGCPGVQTIAEHPKDPNRLAIGGHAGILLSDDLGLHWHQASNGLPAPSPDGHSAPVVKIVWDENDTNRLWAATGLPHDGKERSRVAAFTAPTTAANRGGWSLPTTGGAMIRNLSRFSIYANCVQTPSLPPLRGGSSAPTTQACIGGRLASGCLAASTQGTWRSRRRVRRVSTSPCEKRPRRRSRARRRSGAPTTEERRGEKPRRCPTSSA